MISKIIQKEKDSQDRYFVELEQVSESNEIYVIGKMDCHQRVLINLKEHFESHEHNKHKNDKKEDIKELNKMVEKYENIHKRHLSVR